MTVTSTQFLAAIKRLILAPSNQSLIDNTGFLAIGDRKTQDTIVPLIDSLNGEFYVTTAIQAIVADQSDYRLPSRALGRKLREVKLQNTAGIRFDMPKIAIEREQLYQVNGVPFGFYFKGDRFVLVPTPTTTDYSIQYWYFLGPSMLVPVSSAGLVTAVSGDDVTVSAVPSTFAIGSVIDFIEGVAGNSCLSIDKTIANISGTILTFTTGDVPTDLAVGDYISIAGTTPVLQMPDSAVPYLTTLTAMDVLFGRDDYEGYDRLKDMAAEQKQNLKDLLEPRIEGEATKIVSDNGLVRRRAGRPWRGYFQY